MEIFVHFSKFRMRYYDKSSSISMSVTKQQKCYKIAKNACRCLKIQNSVTLININSYLCASFNFNLTNFKI